MPADTDTRSRGLLRHFRLQAVEPTLELVCVGHQRSDGVGRLVSHSEVRAFLTEQRDPDFDALLAIDGDEAFSDALLGVPLEPSREALADRRWCMLMLRETLDALDPDPVEALMQIEEFWIEWSYPGPHGMLDRNAWVDAEATIDVVLKKLRRWMHDEYVAIERVENPNARRDSMAPR
jgi:hypothetical protein